MYLVVTDFRILLWWRQEKSPIDGGIFRQCDWLEMSIWSTQKRVQMGSTGSTTIYIYIYIKVPLSAIMGKHNGQQNYV